MLTNCFVILKDEIVRTIEQRIAIWTFLPEGNSVSLLLLFLCLVTVLFPFMEFFNCVVFPFNTYFLSENGESMQILHYEHGEKYEPHFDYFHDKVNQQLGGHRIATVLMYLSDVQKGGETIFPNAEVRKT